MAQQTAKRKKMGIVKTLGRAFLGDVRYGEISLPFFSYVMILIVVGLVMMASASYAWAYANEGDGLYYAKNQAISAVIGFIVMIFLAGMDYHNFKKIKIPGLRNLNIAGLLYLFGLIMLVLVLLMGKDEGGSMGAKRWLVIGPINFQPSEVAKLTLIVYFAYSMEKKFKKMNKFVPGILYYALFLAPYAVCIGLEPHLSGLVLICAIAAALIICGGANKWWLIIFLVVGILGIVIIIKWQGGIDGSYVATRLKSWRDPFADILNETWQTGHSLIAIGSGGLFGLGFGNSREKYLYLPETKNDFVFPIVCEELGFIGALAVIFVFILLIIEGYSIAARCRDRFGMLLAVGFTTHIGIQTVFNLAVVSNLIPNTGISLPFFSYGGTALIMQMAEMGIVLNISRERYFPEKDDTDDDDENNDDGEDEYDPPKEA
jgi:cell division protein FtsW